MQRQFVRAAISLYPPGWRRRYGAELEQLALDAGDGVFSPLENIRMVAELAAAGVAQWFRYLGPRTRIAILTLAAGLGALMLNAVQIATAGSNPAKADPGTMIFSDQTKVGPGVVVVHSRVPRHGTSGPTVVTVQPVTGGLTSVTGAPSEDVINPRTEQVISVERRYPPRS